MKAIARLLFSLLLVTSAAPPVHAAGLDAQGIASGSYPKYPLWLARILARFGVADAQALAGFQALTYDPCKGFNWPLASAQQHQLFGEWQLIGYYFLENDLEPKSDNYEKIFLWLLHWRTHFPGEEDRSFFMQRDLLKLPPERERAVRETFKTWTPADEKPMEPASCLSDKFRME